MKYQEILPQVLAGEWFKLDNQRYWMKMRPDGTCELDNGETFYLRRDDMLLDNWVVKPEESPNHSNLEGLVDPQTTLIQAIEQKKIVPGDKVILLNPHEEMKYNIDGYFHDMEDEPQDWSAEHWMNKDFEIIKPEPEVLNANEWVRIRIKTVFHDNLSQKIDWSYKFVKTFEAGERNGILKEQLRIKEAIKLLQWLERKLEIHKERNEYIENVHKALKILSPEE
jgi:hypothetical protein